MIDFGLYFVVRVILVWILYVAGLCWVVWVVSGLFCGVADWRLVFGFGLVV